MASSVRSLIRAFAVVALGASALSAQSARRVAGRVERVTEAGSRGVAGAWVVLHRVARDAQGPLDSVRTDGAGAYALRYAADGDSAAVYFVSTLYAGVAYFSAPLRAADVRGDDGLLTVFDTTSVGVELVTRGRHIIISALDSTQQRTVVEVYEIENISERTRVATEASPSWSVRLPAGASDVRAGAGDIAADAIAFDGGMMQVFAPISPGLRQLTFSYLLPAAAFPWSIPVTDSTMVLEVLVEDPAATVVGAGLAPQASVMLDGRGFQRFQVTDVASGKIVTVTMPATGLSLRTVYVVGIVGIVGLALLLGLARAVGRPGIPTFRAAPATADPATALATAIAALDARFERLAAPTDAERATWEAERATLKAQLGDTLAERDNRL